MTNAKDRKAEPRSFRLLERRLLGVTGYAISKRPGGTFFWQSGDTQLETHLPRLEDKGYVLDLTVLSLRDVVNAEINAPLLGLHLKPGETDPCLGLDENVLSRFTGLARKLAERKKQDPAWSGLDMVSLSAYLAYWRAKGARAGRKLAGRLVWLYAEDTFTPDP